MVYESDLITYKAFTKIKALKKIRDNNITDIGEIRRIIMEAEHKAIDMYNKDNSEDTDIFIIRKLTEEEKAAIEYET